MKCRKCKNDNAEQMSFCTVCGESLKGNSANTNIEQRQKSSESFSGKTMNCHICNTKISEDTIYCHLCGSRQKTIAPKPKDTEATGFDDNDSNKKSENDSKCSTCGKPALSGTNTCALCAKSEPDAAGERLVKHEDNTGKIIKTDIKQIEPMIAMIAKMKTEKAEEEEVQTSKKEQTKAEDKKEKADEKKSNAAKEFLPTENSEENSVGKRIAKLDSVKKPSKDKDAKKQENLENNVPEKAKPEETIKRTVSEDANKSPLKTMDAKKSDEEMPKELSEASKTISIKDQNDKSTETQPVKSVAGNKSSRWKSVPVSGEISYAAAPAQPTVLPKQENIKQPELPKSIPAKNAVVQGPVPAKPPIPQQQSDKQPKQITREDTPVYTVPAQILVPAQVSIQQQQTSMPNPTVSTGTYSPSSSYGATKKGKKAVFAMLVIMIIILLGAAFSVYYMIRSSNYDKAVQYMNGEQYAEAYEMFVKLGSYKDSADNAAECYRFVRYDEAVELMNDDHYDEAAEIFFELGNFKDADELFIICTIFCDAIDFYNDGRYWYAYSTFEKLNGYGDSEAWMEKCTQDPPPNGIADKGEAYADGTASIKIVNLTTLDAFFMINTMDGLYWGGIYIQAGTNATVAIKPAEYSANLAVGMMWFGKADMFGGGKEASYQQNVPIDDEGNTSFFLGQGETSVFTIYN